MTLAAFPGFIFRYLEYDKPTEAPRRCNVTQVSLVPPRLVCRSDAAARPPLSYHVAKKLVFKKVRKALGLDRCTKCYTGAAPITKDTLEFFLSLDIPLYELYGMSESTGPHTISLPEAFKLTRCASAGSRFSVCFSKRAHVGEIWGPSTRERFWWKR